MKSIIYWNQFKLFVKKTFGPIKRFYPLNETDYISVIALPGAEPKDVKITWECNRHITVNTYSMKNIPIGTSNISYPIYYHEMISPPRRCSGLNELNYYWKNGFLIMAYKENHTIKNKHALTIYKEPLPLMLRDNANVYPNVRIDNHDIPHKVSLTTTR